MLAAVLLASTAHAAPLSRLQALAALSQPDVPTRLAGVERLGGIGLAADANRVLERLRNVDPGVRDAKAAAVWQIWGRSGDPKIDKLFSRGVEQMQESALDTATDHVRRNTHYGAERRPQPLAGWPYSVRRMTE